jgi:acyl CoA:acetate/3-ketoacid CoA transferase beta subunit
MAENDGFERVDTPFGEVGLLSPLVPDVALLHAPIADRDGNVAVSPPLLEGVWGALAARRGAIVTVERVVDSVQEHADLVRIPRHRVLAVCEAPMGAHPGGLGEERVARLRRKAAPGSWRDDEQAHPPDLDAGPNRWEIAAVYGARQLADRVLACDADAVLAGAGVANLSAWLGVEHARAAGSHVQLTAEIGLWGYEPTLADPFVLNHRNFPSATMLNDATTVLGALVGGAGTTTVACLGGAQVDRFGNINSTLIPDGPFLVGSGGGNDVASVAAESVVVATLTPQRTPPECGYVTSPGHTVQSLVTDLGVLEKLDRLDGGELVLTAVPSGDGPLESRIEAAKAACGWDLQVAGSVRELPGVTDEEVHRLRRWDPRGWFLRA